MVDTERDAPPSDDYDTPWKTALERYLPELLAFYFPLAHAGIDWRRGWRFLDQELAQVVQDAELGRRWVDKLVAVHRLGAVGLDAEDWIYIHIEIQAGWDGGFPKRLFTYNYRLFDRFDRPVASLAVLADDSPSWRPSGFGFELFGWAAGTSWTFRWSNCSITSRTWTRCWKTRIRSPWSPPRIS